MRTFRTLAFWAADGLHWLRSRYNPPGLSRIHQCLLAVSFVALGGCAPHVRYISTYCLTKDQALPAEPPKVKDKLTGQADKDLTIVSGSAVRLRAWGEGLNTILEGCREPPVK